MHNKSKKAISKLLVLLMLMSAIFSNIDGVNVFASETADRKTIDVWDFGGDQVQGDLYTNHITKDILNSTSTIVSGTFAKTDFGDLSIAKPDAKDRFYYSNEDGTKGTYATDKGKTYTYSDGVTTNGQYYCNGSGGDTRRYLTIDNVVAGDRISVYGFSSGKDEQIHFLYLGTDGTQDSEALFTQAPVRVDFIAQHSGTYKIYVAVSGSSKPNYTRVVRASGVNVSGKVNLNGKDISIPQETNSTTNGSVNTTGSSVGTAGYSLTFVNKTTGDEINVSVNVDNTFDTVLAPGYSYTAVLNAANGYAISDETKLLAILDSDILTGKNDISLNVVTETLATISGSIVGFDNSYDVSKLQITLTPPEGSLSSAVETTIDKQAMTYTAKVKQKEVYTAVLSGVNDYEVVAGGTVSIEADTTQNIQVAKTAVYVATGNFVGLSSTAQVQSITFTNVDDGYTYTGTVANGGYSISLRDGAYTVKPVLNENYETSTHVVINGASTTKDIKLNAVGVVLEPIARVADLYVGDSSKAPYNYNTVKEALAIAARMNPTSEAERITIHIAPGIYRAQLTIKTPYITLANSNPSGEVKITWYYGIGYKYYSLDTAGYYNEDRDFDKYSKNAAAKWGGTVYLTDAAKGFKAENIVFENSFNKYITEEELADGVELAGTSSIATVRTAYTDATSKAATERAAAMLVEADNVEFNKCSFISSQDTLYTGGVGTNNQYYKDCFIEGNTDYIFGDGNAVFDNCELYFCGYSEVAAGGYITAAKDAATYGYLFRNSIVTANNKNMQTAGFFGRPWGAKAKITFLNTKLANASIIDAKGWTDMSGATAEGANFVEYNTTYNGTAVSTASRRGKVINETEAEAVNVSSYFGDWTPAYYTADSNAAPTFKYAPFLTSSDDINTPYPGHTLSLGYEFDNANDNLNDSSLIQWYRVSENGTEELIKTTAAYISKTYKMTSADSGYYIKAIVTPEITNGKKGTPASIKLDNLVRVGNGTGGSNDIPDGELVNIYIAGDSTVKTYTPSLDTAGWGEYLQKYFNADKVKVVNYANGGRSTRNFINEGSLAKISSTIKKGDYLLIQFAHNDSANSSGYLLDRFVSVGVPDANGIYPSTSGVKEATPASLVSSYGAEYYAYTTGTFKWYLQQYIDAARNVGATPILVTPVARQYFNPDGTIRPHHDATDTTTGTVTSSNNAYVKAVEQLGQEQGVKVIDMFTLTKNSFEEAYKNDASASNGSSPLAKAVMMPADATHNNKIGGIYDGGLIAKEIQKLGYNISNEVILPKTVGGVDGKNNLLFEIDSNSKVSVYTAGSNGSYTSQLDTYWTSKTQELVDSLAAVSPQPAKFTIKSTFNMNSLQSGELLDVETLVTNNNSSEDSVLVIVALYDGQNRMINVSYISKDISVGKTEQLNAGFKLPTDVTNHKVEVFVWEGTSLTNSSMIPLSNIATLQ